MFRFRLAKVLRHRQRRVEACHRDVATAEASLQAALAAAAAASRELELSRRRAAVERRGCLSAPDLTRQLAWHEALAQRQRRLEQVVVAARAAVEDARQRLHKAWQEREALRQLQERQRRQWQQESLRSERRALDEVGAVRAALAMRAPCGGSQLAIAGASGPPTMERDRI